MFFFFNATATTEIYTLSLHDALPVLDERRERPRRFKAVRQGPRERLGEPFRDDGDGNGSPNLSRSEEHTSELQSRVDLVGRLLLEKKKNKKTRQSTRP